MSDNASVTGKIEYMKCCNFKQEKEETLFLERIKEYKKVLRKTSYSNLHCNT